jgi:DNA-directed RNA polymerase specialized sigma24 family protein
MNDTGQRVPRGPDGPVANNPLTDALVSHGEGLSRDVLDLFERKLGAHLRRQFSHLSSDDIRDLTVDVLIRLMGRMDTSGPPPHDGYIYRIARNAAVDKLRRDNSKRELLIASTGADLELGGDDDVASAFEAMATAASFLEALENASRRGDDVAYKAATLAVMETERQGKRPSNRWLATKLGLSHTAVNNALDRFRTYLDIGHVQD